MDFESLFIKVDISLLTPLLLSSHPQAASLSYLVFILFA